MSERLTPETDAFAIKFKTTCGEKYWVPVDISRKLERERDEARESLKHITEYGTEEVNAAVDLRQKLAHALVDLDNMQDQRDLAMKVIKRLEQERDEARENLDEEKKFHHRTHAELVQTQCKLLDMQMGRDEIQGKYDNEAVEHMLSINKICNERDILRLDAQKEAERINYLERKLNKEINEANQDHLGWENKWKVAVDMAAIAENKVSNLEDQLDLAMKVIKRLESNQP